MLTETSRVQPKPRQVKSPGGVFDSQPRRRPVIYWPINPMGRAWYKLTKKQLESIQASDLPGVVLAERYGVTPARISQIRNGKAVQMGRRRWWLEGRQANDNS